MLALFPGVYLNCLVHMNMNRGEKTFMKKLNKMLVGTAMVLFAGAGLYAADNTAMSGPVKSVYDHYLKIQADLAGDSLAGVAGEANAIVQVAQSVPHVLPKDVSVQAQALSNASDLTAARAAFKPLSDDLIKYMKDNKAQDSYVQVYCPMAKGSWLQADRNVKNPYMGQGMSGCGIIQN